MISSAAFQDIRRKADNFCLLFGDSLRCEASVTWGWNNVIKFLADHGANVNAPNAQGQTVLEAVSGARGGTTEAQKETAAVLTKLGAKLGTPTAPGAGGAAGGRGGRGARGQ